MSQISRRSVLTAAGALTLAGAASCTGTAAPSAPTVAASGASATSAAAATSAATSAAIRLLSSGDADVTKGQGKALTMIAEAYAQKSKVATILERVPFDQYLASATTKARAGQLPDVVELLPGANFASLFPALIDMAQADVADASALSGWSSSVKDPAKPDVYAGAPVGAQGVVWYYNKALFSKAGLNPDTPPATWADLKAAAGKLKAAGVSPIGMSGSDSFVLWWAWSALSAVYFNAADVAKVRTGEIKLTDKRFADSLAALKELYDEQLIAADYAGKKFTDVEADFGSGKLAMVTGIISNAINWKVWDDKLGKDAYGVMPCPKPATGTSTGQFFNPVLLYGVSAKSANAAAAKGLVAYMASREAQTTLLKEASQFPNRSDVDVVGVTGSKGAGAILDVVKKVGGVDVAQNQFNGAAQQASWTNLTGVMKSGKITEFLSDLEKQQRS